jgi:hypothetical protein
VNTQTHEPESDAAQGRGHSPGNAPEEPASPGDALHEAVARLNEVREYAAYFMAAKLDGLKLTARNLGIYAALGVLGLIAGGAIVVVAVVLLLTGIAHGIGAALGGMFWLGDLIIGAAVLIALALVVVMGMSRLTKSSRLNTVQKYESRKRDQRSRFGHDVKQRARHE